MSRKLYDVAKVLRSKNAGPFAITLDVLFDNERDYLLAKQIELMNKKQIAELYNLEEKNISAPVYFDNSLGIKVTFNREVSSGSGVDRDVYGAQQHAPLMDLLLPD